jgi:hypothetical protein
MAKITEKKIFQEALRTLGKSQDSYEELFKCLMQPIKESFGDKWDLTNKDFVKLAILRTAVELCLPITWSNVLYEKLLLKYNIMKTKLGIHSEKDK